jgi:hypothetical protein
VSDKVAVLRELTFGQRVAEEEGDVLKDYFVETDQWRRIFDGEVGYRVSACRASADRALATR